MSVHDLVDAAVKALVIAAAPIALIVGLDGQEAELDRVPAGGRVAIGNGDPGEPDITLSPITYHYDRSIDIEITAAPATVRAIVDALSVALAADRTLGGVVEWADAIAPLIVSESADGAPVITTASATIVASYSTTRPL